MTPSLMAASLSMLSGGQQLIGRGAWSQVTWGVGEQVSLCSAINNRTHTEAEPLTPACQQWRDFLIYICVSAQ